MVWMEGKDLHYRLQFLHDKSKRNESQEQVLCSIPWCSSIRLILHGPDLPVPMPDGNMEYKTDSEHSDMTIVTGDDAYKPEEDDQPVPLKQAEVNGLTRDLNFSKESARLLSSGLKEKHFLTSGTMFYWYRDRERELRQFFSFRDKSLLVHCNDIDGLIKSMGFEYEATEWRLFIDLSSKILQAVFLHNGNSFSSIHMGHSLKTKETHNSKNPFLSTVKY